MPDITGGYTFASGEKNVDHIKLNTATAGTINTSFHTGKASAGANPPQDTTELTVYDSVGLAFKKSTLQALVFDHTAVLSARAAKTVPVAADAVLISDSGAGGAYKQMTLANVLFGAAALGASTVAGDKIPVFDSGGNTLRTATWSYLLGSTTNLASVDGDERFMVLTSGGNLRSLKLEEMINSATGALNLTGTEALNLYQGAQLKKITLGTVFQNQNTTTTSPVGNEGVLLGSGGATSLISTQNLKLYGQKGYALYRDEKTSGTVGGTLTADGAWHARVLNTESVDNTAGGASVSGNQVTLQAGTWRFRGSAPFFKTSGAQVRLQNVTDASTVAIGTNAFAGNAATSATVRSEVTGRFTIAGAKAFELQYQIAASVSTSDGGNANAFGTEVYSTLEFWQED